ncbi:MAG: transketolase C-terminal domain-containing protein [Weeksellaceae bacterium]|nr:transketolase C-terminal domain-containing protein [Weeksellaceae bacterium]
MEELLGLFGSGFVAFFYIAIIIFVISFEDGILSGGFGDAILEYASEKAFKGKIIRKAYPDEFIGHGSVEELEKQIGLDEESILEFLLNLEP